MHRHYGRTILTDSGNAVHPNAAVFSDPAFGELRGPEAGAMWAMLCARAADLEVTASNVQADDERGRAHWDARYTFGQTGRKVLNLIDAEFEFRDGLIVRHTDTFSFWKWARQARPRRPGSRLDAAAAEQGALDGAAGPL